MTAPDAPRCPYCSGRRVYCDFDYRYAPKSVRRYWFAACSAKRCSATGPRRRTEAEAIAAFCGKENP